MMLNCLRFAEWKDAVAASLTLAAEYNVPFDVRRVADPRVWDSYHAKFVPRTYGWAMWEVLGADGFLFRAPRGYIDPDDPEDNEEEIGHTASGLDPEDEWSYAEGWILFGPNADQYD